MIVPINSKHIMIQGCTGACIAIIGIALWAIYASVAYKAIGMSCLGLGGAIVVISLLRWCRHKKITTSPAISLNPSSSTPKLSSDLIAPELCLPSKSGPLPPGLALTWLGSLSYLADPLIPKPLDGDLSDLTSQLPYDVAKNYRKMHEDNSLIPEPSWSVDRFNRCSMRLRWFTNALDENYRRIPYGEEMISALASCGNWENCDFQMDVPPTIWPNAKALEQIAARYRKAFHISLFSLPIEELNSRLSHETNIRISKGERSYFAFLVTTGDPKTPTVTPLLFYISEKGDLECCLPTCLLEEISRGIISDHLTRDERNQIEQILGEYVAVFYESFDFQHNMRLSSLGQLALLAHALDDVHTKSPVPSLFDVLHPYSKNSLAHYYKGIDPKHRNPVFSCALPAHWTLTQTVVNFNPDHEALLPRSLRSDTLNTRREFLAKYQRTVPSTVTFTLLAHLDARKNFYINFEQGQRRPVPPGVKIEESSEIMPGRATRITVTIPLTMTLNMYPYELQKAVYMQQVQEEFNIVSTTTLISRALLNLIFEYRYEPGIL